MRLLLVNGGGELQESPGLKNSYCGESSERRFESN